MSCVTNALLRGLAVGLTFLVGGGCSGEPGGDAQAEGDPPEVAAQPRPGQLELQCLGACRDGAPAGPETDHATGVDLGRLRQAQSAGLELEMGDLHASRDFLFLLVNSGDTDISEITLSSSDPRFTVEPSRIERLPPQDEATVLPIVRVWAAHGTSPTGIGYVPLMPPGENGAEVTIAGVTTDVEGDALDLELATRLSVVAHVMSFDVFDGDTKLELSTSEDLTSGAIGGLGFVRRFAVVATPRVVNTGNVEIEVTQYRDAYGTPLTTNALALGETMELQPDGSCYAMQSHTVTDAALYQLGSDGAAYFCLYVRGD